jgi:ubiquinone/menaquinone biosynthesis C-methylase UbiE
VKKLSSFNWSSSPFGAEYALRPSWGLLQRSYVRMFGLLDLPNRLRARIVLPELNTLQPKKVLDLGSGTGCYSFYVSRQDSIDVSAVEINQTRVSESEHIAKCLERGNVKFYLGEVHECLQNFCSDSFDLVLAIEVLQLFPNIRLALREIYRVLKPGGCIIGHIPVLGHLRPYEKTLFGDKKIRQLLSDANFQMLRIIPTFGGILRKLCGLYDLISGSHVFVALLFPIILPLSVAFRVENPRGDYRFFVARKPAEEMTED